MTTNYPTKSGFDVLALERNAQIGEGTISEDISGAPGFIWIRTPGCPPHGDKRVLYIFLELEAKFGPDVIEHDKSIEGNTNRTSQ